MPTEVSLDDFSNERFGDLLRQFRTCKKPLQRKSGKKKFEKTDDCCGTTMTQEQLERAIDWGASSISRWEHGEMPPSRDTIDKIMNALGCKEERAARLRFAAWCDRQRLVGDTTVWIPDNV